MTASPPTPEPFVIAEELKTLTSAIRDRDWEPAQATISRILSEWASQSSRIETLTQENAALQSENEISRLKLLDADEAFDVQQSRCSTLEAENAQLRTKADAYDRINTPEIDDFLSAVKNEALHQRERWGAEKDGEKWAGDWFWLLGHLAAKALHDIKRKRLHHIITAAATLLNWHAQEVGQYAQPAISEVPNAGR